ncbi:helix-turn-helix domain-containing protein [Nitratifractor salsuginis]|uniref:Transcriptional regulator, AraC family n=1 Tax=Nitratifractor salsuginis (strain DSM 16511 / JCM 12458 / E9I37-1) TaxID=749222 RepID=E6X0V1_NITSE|nr:AraC family transcriptional regulator [Nitratifractor salsuginis]ADV46883.1 transcriptional regulator, AraC family [Nitratifractor salsuginis DSM 16511]
MPSAGDILMVHSRFQRRSFAAHTHEGYSLSLVLKGVHRFAIEGQRMEAGPGMVRVVHPFEIHETLPSSWEHLNFSVPTKRIESPARAMRMEVPVLLRQVIDDAVLSEKMLSLWTKRADADRRHAEETLLIHLLEKHREDTPPASVSIPADRSLEEARIFIHAHACDPDISLEAMAARASMSKYHFLRQFKRRYGRTPHHYLQNIRIDCVRRKLALGGSLAQIALECGFYDQSHMLKTYRKFYGHTPGSIEK